MDKTGNAARPKTAVRRETEVGFACPMCGTEETCFKGTVKGYKFQTCPDVSSSGVLR